MRDLLRWSVILWAALAILLHLALIGYATIYRNSTWWERPWVKQGETIRWIMAWIISVLFLLGLLTGCANQCPCRPKVPPDRILHLIQTPTLDLVADLGIGIECAWRY